MLAQVLPQPLLVNILNRQANREAAALPLVAASGKFLVKMPLEPWLDTLEQLILGEADCISSHMPNVRKCPEYAR